MSTDKLMVTFIGLFLLIALICFTTKEIFETTSAINQGLVQCKQDNHIIWTTPDNCNLKRNTQ